MLEVIAVRQKARFKVCALVAWGKPSLGLFSAVVKPLKALSNPMRFRDCPGLTTNLLPLTSSGCVHSLPSNWDCWHPYFPGCFFNIHSIGLLLNTLLMCALLSKERLVELGRPELPLSPPHQNSSPNVTPGTKKPLPSQGGCVDVRDQGNYYDLVHHGP